MALASMTGFARQAGQSGAWTWAWEVKTVNAKGFDLRLRLPPGFDALEPAVRADVPKRLARGTCFAALTAQRAGAGTDIRINRPALDALVAALAAIPASPNLQPASLDGLLAVRGVVEVAEATEDEAATEVLHADLRKGLATALDSLIAVRRQEGAVLGALLEERLDRMDALRRRADAAPGRSAEAIGRRLADQVAALAGNPGLDPDRLHQEAVLLAVKADIREELDRLATHIAAARELIAKGGAVGRRLDFLAQELSRESNTLSAKSPDAELTVIGLELKVEVEQFREQVQNLE
ncbi:MAG: YicC family protein [Methylobacteriaceae bacterium]|nr:YicC family protein [Methylobacteriaceae bacterium]